MFPDQPEGVWDNPYSKDKWTLSEGEDRYRRSLYTFVRRTAPYPMLTTFDAPSPGVLHGAARAHEHAAAGPDHC